MTLDAIGMLISVSVFILFNRWGWGILHDETYIVGLMLLSFSYLAASAIRAKIALYIRVALALLVAGLMVIVSTGSIIQIRKVNLAHSFINDSALQIEIAGRFILLGINPYSHTYEQTDLAKWPYRDDAGKTINPALFTNVHPPLLLYVSALQYKVFSRLLGWSDIRMVYLLAYVSLVILAYLKFGFSERFLQFMAFGLLSPLFITFLAQGANDVMVLAFLLWAVYAAEKKRLLAAGIFTGLSLATKQTAWVAFPFLLYWMWQSQPRRQFLSFAGSTMVASLLFYVPLLINDTAALINSLVFYVSSSTTLRPSHPIEGFGFSTLLPKWGIVPSIYAAFPFWTLQLTGLLLVWILFVWTTKKGKKLKPPVVFYLALGTAVTWIFSAYFLPSHVGYILALFGCAYMWHHSAIATE